MQNSYGEGYGQYAGGIPGIELQESLFKMEAQDRLRYAYLLTLIKNMHVDCFHNSYGIILCTKHQRVFS